MKQALIILSFILISMPLAVQEIKTGLADSIKSTTLKEVRYLKIFHYFLLRCLWSHLKICLIG